MKEEKEASVRRSFSALLAWCNPLSLIAVVTACWLGPGSEAAWDEAVVVVRSWRPRCVARPGPSLEPRPSVKLRSYRQDARRSFVAALLALALPCRTCDLRVIVFGGEGVGWGEGEHGEGEGEGGV